jgi:hypothetical protein
VEGAGDGVPPVQIVSHCVSYGLDRPPLEAFYVLGR